MKHSRILSLMDRTIWMMTDAALDGLYRAVEHGLTDADYSLFHAADPSATAILDGLTEDRAVVRGDTGYLFVDGPIVPRDTAFADTSGLTSVQTLTRQYNAFANDPRVKQIAMVIDSPGGAVDGVSEFSQLIAGSEKPVTSFVVGMAASAAYWIASASKKIYSVDTGEVGSIGVVYRSRVGDKTKIREIVSTQSPNKRPDLDSDEGRAVVQANVDDLADVMIGFIAKQRGVTPEQVQSDFGRGGVFIASKAKDAGMIDGIVTFRQFVEGRAARVPNTTQRVGKNKRSNPAGAGRGDQRMGNEYLDDVVAGVGSPPGNGVDIKAAVAKAVQEERTRLQAIEAIASKFADDDQRIKSAVSAAINGAKYADDATVESVTALAYSAAFDAQKSLVNEARAPRQELAKQLESVPSEPKNEKPDSGLSADRIKNMRAAFAGGR